VRFLVRRADNIINTKFWLTRWIGETSLSEIFPCLFSLSNKKESPICDLCGFDMVRGGSETLVGK
jgi:hypothetical protein